MNVEVNPKVTHLIYKSTMKQKIKLNEINGLLDINPLDPAYFRIHEKNRPDPDPCIRHIY